MSQIKRILVLTTCRLLRMTGKGRGISTKEPNNRTVKGHFVSTAGDGPHDVAYTDIDDRI